MIESTGRKRVIITNVMPQVNGGNYPAKAVIQEEVVLSADIFTDGHDEVKACVLLKHRKDRTWKELPMTFISNDRFICSNENGIFEERDATSGRLLKTWPTTQSHQGLRRFKMLSPNLLAAVPRDASLALWNINSQRQLATLAIPALPDLISPHWLAYTPQGFYTGSPGVERFVRWRTGTKLEIGEKWRARRNPAKVKAALQAH
ncbi:MAG: DUF3416 domain-containing protein [Sphingobacteriales bacterium]|nr:MAG: DUF3416 domain-containing protein [Sphingobacteriales bacterium]